jgi:hypothetical protein
MAPDRAVAWLRVAVRMLSTTATPGVLLLPETPASESTSCRLRRRAEELLLLLLPEAFAGAAAPSSPLLLLEAEEAAERAGPGPPLPLCSSAMTAALLLRPGGLQAVFTELLSLKLVRAPLAKSSTEAM